MSAEQLIWLRNDLRLQDNPAIFEASQNSKIRIVYIITMQQWHKHQVSNASIGLRLDVIKNLLECCGELGIKFDILACDLFKDIPDLLLNFCKSNKITTLWINQETPVDENKRDSAVITLLNQKNINVLVKSYDLIVSQPVLNLSHQPYKVFSSYYKKWLTMIRHQNNNVLPAPKKQSSQIINNAQILTTYEHPYRKDLWPADNKSIKQRLSRFCQSKLFNYEKDRDFPNVSATSLMSAYLALGCLGPRECLEQIKRTYENSNFHNNDAWLMDGWLRELAWRDFYRQLMIHYPHISKNENFKTHTKFIPWKKDDESFKRWTQGQTGFPIIDAGMRQLLKTGWMHNRLRMLTGSFLTKLLMIDWREGEKHFMQNLIDCEFSANNGGWQWCASTGCDSAPYFRIFNPTLQSEKFDKTGKYIRKFIPELSHLDHKSIHNPTTKQRDECHYPEPIVDYKFARNRAIETFKNL